LSLNDAQEVSVTMNRFAVVTGASRGIGAAYARTLAAQGWDLLLVARDRPRLEQLSSELAGRHSIRADVEVADLGLVDAAHRLYVASRERRSVVDLLINNAGFGLHGDFVDMPMPRIQEMLRLHMNTVVESMRLFLPAMVERRSGGIINVASVAGFFAVPYLAEYAATKAFLINFSEGVAEEVRPFGIRIQACCPGRTRTDFHATAQYQSKNLLGTITAEEVARRSLARLERGPVIVSFGWRERAVMGFSRLVPRSWLTRAGARWMKGSR
jgi:short-subunit dehydrogenase